MGGIASKWDEMNEVNEAQEEVDNEQKTRKKSLTDRLKTRILRSDPRSASEGVDRTPIAIERPCETPVRPPKELVDPSHQGWCWEERWCWRELLSWSSQMTTMLLLLEEPSPHHSACP